MPTPQLKWPTEVETQRKEALQAATEAIRCLQEAQQKVDQARTKIYLNANVATILLDDAARLSADAQTKLEHIQMYISLARATPLKSRWGVGAASKREDSEQAAKSANGLLEKVVAQVELVQGKVERNPNLAEAIVARVAQWQAQALSYVARLQRLLTEASIGKE